LIIANPKRKISTFIESNELFKMVFSIFIAVAIFIGGFNGVASVNALTFDYVDPVYDFPDTGGGRYVFGTYAAGWAGYHLAIDLRRPMDTSVYSILDGTVVACGYMQGFGDKNGPGGAAIIAHKNKYGETFYALYGHLKELEISPGQNVSKSQRIAKVMNLINDYGVANPHLHFGINTVRASYAGYTSEANSDGFVDPYLYLEQNCKSNATETTDNDVFVFKINDNNVLYANQNVKFPVDAPAQLVGGKTLVPLRAIGSAVGIDDLAYSGNKITFTGFDGYAIEMTIGSTVCTLTKDGTSMNVTIAAPVLINGITMLPLRDATNLVGGTVKFEDLGTTDRGYVIVSAGTFDDADVAGYIEAYEAA